MSDPFQLPKELIQIQDLNRRIHGLAQDLHDTRQQLSHANDRIAVLLVACHLAAQHHQGSSSIPGRALRAAIAMAERGES